MKKVRLLGICMLALVLGMGFASCGKDEYHSRLKELIIKDYLDVSELGDEFTKEFRNEDLTNYTANPDQSWVHVTLDVTTSKMTVKVDENDTFDSRTAIVTLMDTEDGVTSRTFKVTQKQCNAIKIKDGSYVVDTNGGQVVIEVESNVEYQVTVQDADWLTLPGNKTRGLVSSKVVLEAARNTTEKERTATVVLEDPVTEATDMVIVTQKFTPYFAVPKTEYQINENGGEINVYIQTNVSFDFNLDPEDSWISKAGREVINDNTVCQKLTVKAFKEKAKSRSTVADLVTSWGNKETVTITQIRNLYIKEESIKMMAGDSIKLSLYNASGNAVLWTSGDETVATVDGAGMVKGLSGGSTVIKVESADGLYSDNVAVTVEEPIDLKDDLVYEWQPGFSMVDGTSILSSIKCTLTNNSKFDLTLVKCTWYCDEDVLGYINYNAVTGKLPVAESKQVSFDIAIEYEPDVEEYDEENDRTTIIPGKAKPNTHTYTVVWDYKYSNSQFSFTCVDPDKAAATRKVSTRKARR